MAFDVIKEVENLIAAPSCDKDLKAKAQAYLKNSKDESVRKAFLDELSEDVCFIDSAIGFFEGGAKKLFGEEAAAKMLSDAKEKKAQGEKYCTCDACQAGKKILEHKDLV